MVYRSRTGHSVLLALLIIITCFKNVMAGEAAHLTEKMLSDKIILSQMNDPYNFGTNLLHFMTTGSIDITSVERSIFPQALYFYSANLKLKNYRLTKNENDLDVAEQMVDKSIAFDPNNALLYFLKSYLELRRGQEQRSSMTFVEACSKNEFSPYHVELTKGIISFLKNNYCYTSYNAVVTYAYIDSVSLDTGFLIYLAKSGQQFLSNNSIAEPTRINFLKTTCNYLCRKEPALSMLTSTLLLTVRSIVVKFKAFKETCSCSEESYDYIQKSAKGTLNAMKDYSVTMDSRVLDASPLWKELTNIEKPPPPHDILAPM